MGFTSRMYGNLIKLLWETPQVIFSLSTRFLHQVIARNSEHCNFDGPFFRLTCIIVSMGNGSSKYGNQVKLIWETPQVQIVNVSFIQISTHSKPFRRVNLSCFP